MLRLTIVLVLLIRVSSTVVEMDKVCDIILDVFVDCSKIQDDYVSFEFTQLNSVIQRVELNRLTGIIDLNNLPAVERIIVKYGTPTCEQILRNSHPLELQLNSDQTLTCLPEGTTTHSTSQLEGTTPESTTRSTSFLLDSTSSEMKWSETTRKDHPSSSEAMVTAHSTQSADLTTDDNNTGEYLTFTLGSLFIIKTTFILNTCMDFILEKLVQFHDHIIHFIIVLGHRQGRYFRRYPTRNRRAPIRLQYH